MKKRILAIDDEPDLLRLIDRIITEKTSYELTITNTSLEVPEILKNNEYEVIVTDLKMPGMDGMEILKYVKENNRNEQVIIITAFGSLDSASEAVSNGVFDYIVKPFRKEQLLFTLDRAMRYHQAVIEIASLQNILNMEPYEKAEKAFKNAYIKKLNDRYGDMESASLASGLDISAINPDSILTSNDPA